MNKLKLLRGQRGFTQEELASQVGMTRDTYKNYEQQRTEMGYEVLIKLADYFGCSIDYLLGHQTTNTLQLDGLREEQRQIINLAIKMDEKQATFALGQLSIIMKLPDTQIAPARPF